MIATNLCVWLNVLILETNHEIVDLHSAEHAKQQQLDRRRDAHIENDSESHNQTDSLFSPTAFDLNHLISQCQRNNNIMSNLLAKSGPFLFPCTIEYTLICAAVLFAMWKNIPEEHEHYKHHKRRKKISRSLALNTVLHDAESGAGENHELAHAHHKSAHHYSVDCANANTGLFSGIFVMVLVIISLIVFFVLISSPDERLKKAAIEVASLTELALYLITSIAVLIGMCQVSVKNLSKRRVQFELFFPFQMRKLWYDNSANLCLDNLLLVVAQTGVFIYSAFCIIGAFFQLEDHLLAFLASLATLVQTTLQTVFILDSSSRFACTNDQVKRKPGRQVVTFLLVCNLAMWAINTLETNRADSHPIQVKFYGGEWAWPIITHVSMPLAIFYRFHSTVCLCEIWKKSFKFKNSS